jgi:hypothetical protein
MVLTKDEKCVILFVVIALLLGLAAKFYRDRHPQPDRPQKRSHVLVHPPGVEGFATRGHFDVGVTLCCQTVEIIETSAPWHENFSQYY